MNINLKCLYSRVAIISVALMAILAMSGVAGARINVTQSIPVGLYWTTDGFVEKGAYVLFCPPDIGIFAMARARNYLSVGFCPGDYGYMMKRVLAVKGDRVRVTDDGVFVDGVLLPHSKLAKADGVGRVLPRYPSNQYTLGRSELLLMSDVSDTSFDGRYFGPISYSQVKSVIRPIMTW